MSQSSWKEQIKKKWGPHSHCPVCRKAMPADKQFCSQVCRDNYLAKEKKGKKKKSHPNDCDVFNVGCFDHFYIIYGMRNLQAGIAKRSTAVDK